MEHFPLIFSMDIQRKLSMDIHGNCPWISMDFFPWISMENFPWISMEKFPWVPMENVYNTCFVTEIVAVDAVEIILYWIF